MKYIFNTGRNSFLVANDTSSWTVYDKENLSILCSFMPDEAEFGGSTPYGIFINVEDFKFYIDVVDVERFIRARDQAIKSLREVELIEVIE